MQIKSGDETKASESLAQNMQSDPCDRTVGDCEWCRAETAAASSEWSSLTMLSQTLHIFILKPVCF